MPPRTPTLLLFAAGITLILLGATAIFFAQALSPAPTPVQPDYDPIFPSLIGILAELFGGWLIVLSFLLRKKEGK